MTKMLHHCFLIYLNFLIYQEFTNFLLCLFIMKWYFLIVDVLVILYSSEISYIKERN